MMNWRPTPERSRIIQAPARILSRAEDAHARRAAAFTQRFPDHRRIERAHLMGVRTLRVSSRRVERMAGMRGAGFTESAAGLFPNDPVTLGEAGWTRNADNPWSSYPQAGVNSPDLLWVDDEGGTNRSITTYPGSICQALDGNTNVLDIIFKTSLLGGTAPCGMYRPNQAGELKAKMYVAHVWWMDPLWTDGGNAGTKIGFINGDSVNGSQFYWGLNAFNEELSFEQQGGISHSWYANVGGPCNLAPLLGGQMQVEIRVEANSNDSTADGVLKCWLNGALRFSYTTVQYQMAAARQWLGQSIIPIYGGGSNPPPYDMQWQFDHSRTCTSN